MESKNITRFDLYNLVWSTPMSKLAIQFGISSNRIKTVCEKSDIPLPKNGFWLKIKYGKEVIKPELPESTKKEGDILFVSTGNGNKVLPQFKNEIEERAYQLSNDPSLSFTVPNKVKSFHPIILKTKKEMAGKDYSEAEVRIYYRHYKDGVLPMLTDENLTPRALRFMNTLILVIEQLKGSLIFEYQQCYVQMFRRKTEIHLRQKHHRVRNKNEYGWSHNSWVKTNKLEFQVGPNFSNKKWIDTDKRKIEEGLPEIVACIEKECKYWHDLRKQQAEDEKKREIERAKKAELQHANEMEEVKNVSIAF